MYLIIKTKAFLKSYERLKRGGLSSGAINDIDRVLNILKQGEKLGIRYQDHQLKGEYRHYRECHIRSDLLLIYQVRADELILLLLDMGSHSYLFGR